MKTRIKKVSVNWWNEYQVWKDEVLIGTYQSIAKANRILKELL